MKKNLDFGTNRSFDLTKMKKGIVILVIALGYNSFSFAQACGGFGQVLKTSWEELYKPSHAIGQKALKLIPFVGQDEEATRAIADASTKFHNFIFNENRQSWATVGARDLPVLNTVIRQHGTLVKAGVGGVRTFTTAPVFWDTVEITIDKTDGKAETEIIICTWDMESGAKNNVEEYTFANGNNTASRRFVIRDTWGKSISIKLRNKSVANTFKYTIKSQGTLDMNKQRRRGQANTQQATVATPVKGKGSVRN